MNNFILSKYTILLFLISFAFTNTCPEGYSCCSLLCSECCSDDDWKTDFKESEQINPLNLQIENVTLESNVNNSYLQESTEVLTIDTIFSYLTTYLR